MGIRDAVHDQCCGDHEGREMGVTSLTITLPAVSVMAVEMIKAMANWVPRSAECWFWCCLRGFGAAGFR